jgi:hypothetical protein
MGSQVIFWFMKWWTDTLDASDYYRVEAEGYGNGGRTWCNDNIAAFVNVKPVLAARWADAL